MSSQRALASQHNTRDGQTPRSHTQCPPYTFALPRHAMNRFLSTFAVLSMLPTAFAPFARALHARPSPLLSARGAFLGAVSLGLLENATLLNTTSTPFHVERALPFEETHQ